MTAFLSAPDMQRSFCIGADWLEVLTLVRIQRYATDADILQPNGILDDRAEPEAVAPGQVPEDRDIVDPKAERALDAVFEELAARRAALGGCYPFSLSISPRRLRISVADEPATEAERHGRAIYIACLMMSAVRSGIFDARAAGVAEDPTIGNLFQICATLAAAGYLNGDAYWFGHPRPDETTLLDAVTKVTALLGMGRARQDRPDGETRYAKDAGIDVIAWRDHHDGRPAKLLLYGQCASGMNWEGKPVSGKVQRLATYFTLGPSQHWLPALFTPFPLYMDKENANGLSSEEQLTGFYRQSEAEMGIIIDRNRLVRWAVEALQNVKPSAKDAADRLGDLFHWSDQALAASRAGATL